MVNQRSNIEWTPYKAIEYAEGFGDGEDATTEQQLEAWAYILQNELYINLQGWFGRRIRDLVEFGLLTREGMINWDRLDEIREEESELAEEDE